MAPRTPKPSLRSKLLHALELKELPRAGWLRVGVPQPESVAAHSWGVAWLVLALCPAGVDRERALAMAVLHDLPEVLAGDVTPHDGVSDEDKRGAEQTALEALTAPFAHRDELRELWLEFETQSTPEGRFVRACDKLDMALQAARYQARDGIDTQEFVDSALTVLGESELAALVVSGTTSSGGA